MSFPKPIKSGDERYGSMGRSPFNNSLLVGSPIAQESLARDLAEYPADEIESTSQYNSEDESSEASTVRLEESQHSMTHSYRRPSFVAFGGTRPAVTPQFGETTFLSKKERHETRNEERSLLRDNHLAPPKHPQPPKRSALNKLYRKLFSTKIPKNVGDEESGPPSETSALLPNGQPESTRSRHERLNRQWEEAVAAGKIKTTWQREAKTLWRYSSPLVVTFVLQYSLTVARLATSLDTLCAQAYGSGRKALVGLQLQRMLWFLWALTIPIGVLWLSAEKILEHIVPEKRSAELAGLYLRVLLIGAPGFAAFESGKRFVQAQGLFSATTYVLLICAPLNAFLNWLFVWKFEWGFIGAPIAVAVTDNLLPLLLFLYVRFIDGADCWDGFTRRAFHNWGPMIKLALPGLIMVEAEYLAFEVLTLAASYFSVTHLAAQSILSTLTALTFQIPFSISIAASTRVANLIGATLSDAAKTSAKVAIYAACLVGVLNVILLSSLRNFIPQLFTDDHDVILLVSQVLPLCAAFQLFDALSANCSGLLRGLGRQEIGGYVNIFCYYVLAMPISFGTAFGLGWQLQGLWLGVALALGLVAAIEGWFLWRMNWETAVEAAQNRNAAG
ncbi:hypothetical protein CJF30_00006494 [Rutstroemia sp. NJR-2017a BBW]|nr:hypothetical protein CJF30_00006494 [Rutstroemia sp. NJR-2017a BBW]